MGPSACPGAPSPSSPEHRVVSPSKSWAPGSAQETQVGELGSVTISHGLQQEVSAQTTRQCHLFPFSAAVLLEHRSPPLPFIPPPQAGTHPAQRCRGGSRCLQPWLHCSRPLPPPQKAGGQVGSRGQSHYLLFTVLRMYKTKTKPLKGKTSKRGLLPFYLLVLGTAALHPTSRFWGLMASCWHWLHAVRMSVCVGFFCRISTETPTCLSHRLV